MYGIAPAKNIETVVKRNGKVRHIIEDITSAITEGVAVQVREFAKQFSPDDQGLKELWKWVKTNIEYEEDGDTQIIQEPARLAQSKKGDCKSMTLFVASVLQNMGLDFIIKYVHYNDTGTNHVYATAILKDGTPVIVDTVWKRFNEQKEPFKIIRQQYFKNKKDMDVYRFSGVGGEKLSNAVGMVLNIDTAQMTTAQEQAAQANLDYIIQVTNDIPDSVLENDITQMGRSEFLSYLGYNVQSLAYDNTPAFNIPFEFVTNTPDSQNGYMLGVGVGSIISKIGDAIKNLFKKLVNWIMKGPIQASSPALLYAFIKQGLNLVIDKKTAQAKNTVKWLADKTGTSESNMMAVIAAGIKEKTGKSYAENLTDLAKGQKSGFAGTERVGFAWAAAIEILIGIIDKVIAFFKKNKSEAPVIDAPADSDWTFPTDTTSPTNTDLPNYDPNAGDSPQLPSLPKQGRVIVPSNTPSNGGYIPPQSQPTATNNNMIMYLLFGGVALYALSKK